MTPEKLSKLFEREKRQQAALAKTQAALSAGIASYSRDKGYLFKLRPEAARLEVMQ